MKSWLMAGCLLLGLCCLSRAADAATVHVQIHNFFYSPSIDTIILQDSVVWDNVSASNHTSTCDSIPSTATPWDTGTIGPGGSGGTKFTQLGVYRYHCAIHGAQLMTGRIVVISSSPVQGTSWSKLKQLYRGSPGRLTVSGRSESPPRPD